MFGGTIKGDYGTNRYAPLWQDESTPISRGVSAIYQHVNHELSAVKVALPAPKIDHSGKKGERLADFLKFSNSLDPSRVIYNGLVPFAVSMFEYFFSQVFQVLIAYDEFALKKRLSHKQRIEFKSLLDVSKNQRSIENVIAESYTFQNLDQLNRAYKDWLDIDVRKILYKRKKVGKSVTFLENRISDIIQYRHGVVHHFAIDRTLTKDGYIHILDAIGESMDELVKYIEEKYCVTIEAI